MDLINAMSRLNLNQTTNQASQITDTYRLQIHKFLATVSSFYVFDVSSKHETHLRLSYYARCYPLLPLQVW